MKFHPAALIVFTLSAMIGLQFMSAPWLLALTALMVLQGRAINQNWARLLQRNRWLLVMLFIVFAYGLPGEGIGDFEWTPSVQGLFEATIHALRFVTLLGLLASLLSRCSHQNLLLGLWSLMQPFQHLGLPVERSIVRLALVLESITHISHSSSRPSFSFREWKLELKQVLSPEALEASALDNGRNTIQIQPKHWHAKDVLLILAGQLPLLSSWFST